MRLAYSIFFFAFALIALAVLSCGGNEIVKGTGTIEYLDLEGGFYGIIADDGEHYDPINLPVQFQHDGMRVRFKAEIINNQTSTHMWGTIVEVVWIVELR